MSEFPKIQDFEWLSQWLSLHNISEQCLLFLVIFSFSSDIYIFMCGGVWGEVLCVSGGGGLRVCVCVYEKERKYPEIYECHYKNQFRNFMYIVS